ncbi:hypothetical protein [Paraburkholderia bannensis]|uniref:hypothetical protein n=1 Tax=Paraburkholderia bannensis TaxID=765414 RepID=UPI002AC34CCD|nr:hypothetical protein [Paraburkholderia bannensis]
MKGKSPNFEEQLLDIRSRLRIKRRDTEFYETASRLLTLMVSLEKLGDGADPELYKHFPVAAIAALEAHFKAVVSKIVDTGPPYLERGLTLAGDRLRSASQILPIVHGNKVSAGELIAHVIPFNSVATIENALSSLLGTDFKALVGTVVNEYDQRSPSRTPQLVVPDVAALWKELALAFERRHILAHEAATGYEVTFADAKLSVQSARQLCDAIQATMWMTIWKDVPLTQSEMNIHAYRQMKQTRIALGRKLRIAMAIAASRGERARFRRTHMLWRDYAKGWSPWQAELYAGGTIQPLIRATAEERTFSNRLSDVKSWISAMQPEAPPDDD